MKELSDDIKEILDTKDQQQVSTLINKNKITGVDAIEYYLKKTPNKNNNQIITHIIDNHLKESDITKDLIVLCFTKKHTTLCIAPLVNKASQDVKNKCVDYFFNADIIQNINSKSHNEGMMEILINHTFQSSIFNEERKLEIATLILDNAPSKKLEEIIPIEYKKRYILNEIKKVDESNKNNCDKVSDYSIILNTIGHYKLHDDEEFCKTLAKTGIVNFTTPDHIFHTVPLEKDKLKKTLACITKHHIPANSQENIARPNNDKSRENIIPPHNYKPSGGGKKPFFRAALLTFLSVASFGAISYFARSDVTNLQNAAKSSTSITQTLAEYTVKPVISNISMVVDKFVQTIKSLSDSVLQCVKRF